MKSSSLWLLTFALLIFTSLAYSSDKISPLNIQGAKTVNTQEVKKLYDNGALFVDVRSNKDWSSGRVPDAMHIELKKVFSNKSLSEEASMEEAIVIYCNGEKCLRSSKATVLAVSWGFKKVFYYRDGFPAWKKAGYPVE